MKLLRLGNKGVPQWGYYLFYYLEKNTVKMRDWLSVLANRVNVMRTCVVANTTAIKCVTLLHL